MLRINIIICFWVFDLDASEVTTLCRYTNVFIIIIIIIFNYLLLLLFFKFFLPQVVKIPGVKNYKS